MAKRIGWTPVWNKWWAELESFGTNDLQTKILVILIVVVMVIDEFGVDGVKYKCILDRFRDPYGSDLGPVLCYQLKLGPYKHMWCLDIVLVGHLIKLNCDMDWKALNERYQSSTKHLNGLQC